MGRDGLKKRNGERKKEKERDGLATIFACLNFSLFEKMKNFYLGMVYKNNNNGSRQIFEK